MKSNSTKSTQGEPLFRMVNKEVKRTIFLGLGIGLIVLGLLLAVSVVSRVNVISSFVVDSTKVALESYSATFDGIAFRRDMQRLSLTPTVCTVELGRPKSMIDRFGRNDCKLYNNVCVTTLTTSFKAPSDPLETNDNRVSIWLTKRAQRSLIS